MENQTVILVKKINTDNSFTFYKISSGELRALIMASLGHDSGKMGIALNIIDKKGTFSSEERALMKAHPQMTGFLFDTVSLQDARTYDAAIQHHQNADEVTSLYPRIISILDVFEALTSPLREYRTPLTPLQMKDELVLRAEKNELDPDLVRYIIGDILLIEQLHQASQQQDVLDK